ncbi:MAG: hypothetical protein WD928_09020 [Gammaproteobacteria bacterium]
MATNDDLNKDVEQLKKDLAALREDIGTLTNTIKSEGTRQAKAAYGRARQQGDNLRQKGEDAVDSIAHTIDEKPMTSVLTSFGVGLLLGMMVNQRRN